MESQRCPWGSTRAGLALSTACPDDSTVTGQFQYVLVFCRLAMHKLALDWLSPADNPSTGDFMFSRDKLMHPFHCVFC